MIILYLLCVYMYFKYSYLIFNAYLIVKYLDLCFDHNKYFDGT